MAKYISEVLFDGRLPDSSYLNTLPAVRHLKEVNDIKFTSDVTFFVGENGTGKSTLLEAIAVAYGFNAEGGSKNLCFSTNDTHSELYAHLTLLKRDFARDGFFLRAESLYNVATNIEELDKIPAASPFITDGYGGVSLHKQSHGESFLSIVKNRFFGNGLYILDEPEAALSPMRLMVLMTEMSRLVRNGSQLIIATHSPILMTFPDAQILEFSSDGIDSVAYHETEHFSLTKQFLEDPDRMLHHLIWEKQSTET